MSAGWGWRCRPDIGLEHGVMYWDRLVNRRIVHLGAFHRLANPGHAAGVRGGLVRWTLSPAGVQVTRFVGKAGGSGVEGVSGA